MKTNYGSPTKQTELGLALRRFRRYPSGWTRNAVSESFNLRD